MTESFWEGFLKVAKDKDEHKRYSFGLSTRDKMSENDKHKMKLDKSIVSREHRERMHETTRGTHPVTTGLGALAGAAIGGALGHRSSNGKAIAGAIAGAMMGGGTGHLGGRYLRAGNKSKLEAEKDRRNYLEKRD